MEGPSHGHTQKGAGDRSNADLIDRRVHGHSGQPFGFSFRQGRRSEAQRFSVSCRRRILLCGNDDTNVYLSSYLTIIAPKT